MSKVTEEGRKVRLWNGVLTAGIPLCEWGHSGQRRLHREMDARSWKAYTVGNGEPAQAPGRGQLGWWESDHKG